MKERTPSSAELSVDADALIEENFAPLYRFAFCMSLAHDRAAELTQKVLSDGCHRSSAEAGDKCAMLTALHRDWSQGRTATGNAVSHEVERNVMCPLIATSDAAAMDQSDILQIVHSMSERLRLVLSLFYFENLSYTELGQILDLPAETIISRLAEAKTLLRHRLEEHRTMVGSSVTLLATGLKGGPGG